ncbi:phage portal protein [Cupriavidus sp. 2TAF22]|uniref:phage portal protein n=1 Tax=unclassified Cupriavidus TaxID=2640874 RepID=UPI003F8DC7D2
MGFFDFLRGASVASDSPPADEPPAGRVEPTFHNQSVIVQSSDPTLMEYFGGGGQPSAAGKAVTEDTAARVAMVFACTRLIAGAMASLPLHFYERTAGGGRQRWETPLWWLFNEQPTPRFSAATFWEYIIKSILFHGDGFATLRRNSAGTPVQVVPHHPADVLVERKGDRLAYYVQDLGVRRGYDQDDVLHFPGFGFDGRRSLSVIQYAAKQQIGFNLTTDEFRGRFMSQGLHTPFFFQTDKKMDPDKREMMRSEFERKYRGYQNVGAPMVLTEGVTLKTIQMSMADAQLIEQLKMSNADICRSFGVPPFMVGDPEGATNWGSGIEQQGIGFVMYTLQPYTNRNEQEVNRKLFRTSKYFGEFNVDGLRRGDQKSRAEFFKTALGGTQSPGWMVPNEVRAIENMPPIVGGDKLFAPVAKPNGDKPNEGTQEPA